MTVAALQDTPSPHRAAALVTAAGLAAIVVVSICYAISPEAAVMPVAPLNLAAAMAGAKSGQPIMQFISAIGMPADVLTAAGAMLLAWGRFYQQGRGVEALGWMLLGLSSFFFLAIDIIAGAVLSPLSVSGDASAFHAVKAVFDPFFIAGVMCLSIGALLAAIPNLDGKGVVSATLSFLIALVGLLGLASSAGALMGMNLAKPMGISIAAGAALFILVALRIAAERASRNVT